MKRAQRLRARRDHGQAAAHVALPVLRARLAQQQRLEAAGDRADRRERVVELVADHADQALPGLALLVAQRAAHVGQHDELHRLAALAEAGAAHVEAAGGRPGTPPRRCGSARPSGTARGRPPRRRGRRSRSEGAPSSRSPARFMSCSSRRRVEREHGDVDLLHHLAQQRRRLEGARAAARAASGRARSPPRAPARARRRAAPTRARNEKSSSRSAASRFESVCSGRATASRARGGEARATRRPRPLRASSACAAAGRSSPEQPAGEHERRQRRRERQQLDAQVVRQASPPPRGIHASACRARARTAAAGGRGRCATGRARRPRG